ncbi:MAG TPA: VWA domain-containing protein, partial [Bacteroidota bacterium]|nr:VWA domain-containing protein [Bacteroidota bacterium]
TTAFASRTLTINEVYQPAIVKLSLAYREGGVVLDSLIRPIYIPATPVSDTGLSVSIDSMIFSSPQQVQVIFQTRKTSTGALITGLTPQNVWVYDNGARINDISVGLDTTGARKIDVVFVLDVTGSMSNEIDAVKSNIEEFADSMQAHALAFRLGMVTFLDNIENVYDLTPNVAAFKQSVAAQYAHGGDDEPENSLDALYRASELPFAEGARRLFIWITDATYHEKDAVTSRSRQDVISRLLLTDVTVYCIGNPYDQTDWYNPIVNATGGLYYDIYGNFRDIMLDISRHQASGKSVVSFHPLPGTTHAMTLWVHYGGLGGSDTVSFGSSGSVLASSGLRCYPNPFNPTTVLSAQWPEAGEVRLQVYDLLGQEVATLANGRYPAGRHTFTFDARGLGSGTYFVRLEVRSPEGRIIARDVTKILHLK